MLGDILMFDGDSKNYNLLKKKYLEYVDLYKFFNNGSTKGVTTFSEFYWRFNYYLPYQDANSIGIGN